MHPSDNSTVNLAFALEVEGDWPPVGAECLPFAQDGHGLRLLVAPLFVKGLSVGDVIECEVDDASQQVWSWRHRAKSDHSTLWVLPLGDEATWMRGLEEMRALGCSTVGSEQLGAFSVDVPGTVSVDAIDLVLEDLEDRGVPVAYPSWRHE